MGKKKIIGMVISGFCALLFAQPAKAAVNCAFPVNLGVEYTAGVPSPTISSCTLEITNDESRDLAVHNVTIDSNSMAFQNVGSGWTCAYTETSATPNSAGNTVCTPSAPLVLAPGNTHSFPLTFAFENLSGSGTNLPNTLALNIVLNGEVSNVVYTDLNTTNWSITATENETPVEVENNSNDCSGSIGNTVWLDINKNGVQDEGEPGIGDVRVCAYDGNDKDCDRTNSRGRYKIKNLCKGNYDVRVKTEGVAGMILTYDPDGKLDHKTDVKLKSDSDKHTKADFGYTESLAKTGKDSLIFRIALFTALLMSSVGLMIWGRKLKKV